MILGSGEKKKKRKGKDSRKIAKRSVLFGGGEKFLMIKYTDRHGIVL